MLKNIELVDDRNEFLSAIQQVLQSKSSSTEADLLGAAACQYLFQGPARTEDILSAVERIWPDSKPSISQMDSALQVSQDLGLVYKDASSAQWQLTANGLVDIQQHATWVNELRERTTIEIRIRSREGLGIEPDAEQSRLWLDALVSSLVPAIELSLKNHLGSVMSLIDGRANATILDPKSVLESLATLSQSESITEFLQSLATSALDPVDTFGRELVTHIATGVLLHTYLAGNSGRQLTQRLGTPIRQRAILDTPVLIALIGTAHDRKDAEATIRRALKDGWNVVVANHSLEELSELVEREIPNLKRLYTEAHERNARIDFYASLVDDQFHGIVISALQEGTYSQLQQIIDASNDLPQRLRDLGVIVRDHGNNISQDRYDACLHAFQDHVEQSMRKRSKKVISRDADTLTMAWRRRSRETSANWPGAWIITSDRAMNHVYSTVSADRVAITLSLPQWTTVLSMSAAPEELSGFASLAAGQFVDEAIWELPARFPKDAAMQLAAQLSPEQGGSQLDIYHAQKLHGLPEMLDQIAENSSPTKLSAEVMAARARRLNSLTDNDRSRKNQQMAIAYMDASKAKDSELKAHKELLESERNNNRIQAEFETEKSKRIAGEEKTRIQTIKFKRVIWSIGFGIAASAWFLCTILFGNIVTQLISGAALAGIILLSIKWCRDHETRLHVLSWAVISELLGAASAAESLFVA